MSVAPSCCEKASSFCVSTPMAIETIVNSATAHRPSQVEDLCTKPVLASLTKKYADSQKVHLFDGYVVSVNRNETSPVSRHTRQPVSTSAPSSFKSVSATASSPAEACPSTRAQSSTSPAAEACSKARSNSSASHAGARWTGASSATTQTLQAPATTTRS